MDSATLRPLMILSTSSVWLVCTLAFAASESGVPAVPTELTGYATSESSVHLTWKDNSTSEDTFEVLQSDSLVPRNWSFYGSRIRSVGANTVQVDLEGLSPGHYAFAVRARNAAGASETSNSSGFFLPRKPCEETETGTCLQRGRFDVWVHFGPDDDIGHAQVKPVDLGDASTLMYFFDESNVEMLIKVLDGCRINNRFWVFAAAATDLQYYLYVWDTTTGVAAIYYNSPGTAPRAVTDTQAFTTCDR